VSESTSCSTDRLELKNSMRDRNFLIGAGRFWAIPTQPAASLLLLDVGAAQVSSKLRK
jgi:hypothetical protein